MITIKKFSRLKKSHREAIFPNYKEDNSYEYIEDKDSIEEVYGGPVCFLTSKKEVYKFLKDYDDLADFMTYSETLKSFCIVEITHNGGGPTFIIPLDLAVPEMKSIEGYIDPECKVFLEGLFNG